MNFNRIKNKRMVIGSLMVIALLGVATGTSVAVAQHSHATHVAKQTHKTHKVTKKFAKKESSSSSSSSESSISSEVQSSVVASSATVQPKTQASAAAAPATQQTVASGTQLVTPNVYVYGAPGLCLGYVDSAFGVAGRGGSLSYSARSAVDKASAIGAMHNDANFPAGKMVPVFWNLTGNDDGVNYGHIAIWDGNGGFYWEGNHTSTPNHLSYAEVQAVLNGQMELNGAHITDTFHGASLIGWSDNLEGVQILSK